MFKNTFLTLILFLGCILALGFCNSKGTSISSLHRFRRQLTSEKHSQGEWCEIPPPLRNGRLRPSQNRCRPGNISPACKMTPGAYVFPDWVLYLDYCNPGYKLNTTNDIAVCVDGKWLPRLPVCVASNSSNACIKSETVANGKVYCRGEVVFEDSFSGPTLDDHWSQDVYFPDGDDYKFTVFTPDEENGSLRNGSMVITPSLMDDDLITSGTLELKGCTSTLNTTACVRTGSSDKILPPIGSSLWHTYDTLKFRYGEVEIRAKMPMGDWLGPELVLDAKDYSYGRYGPSGFIRIVSRGNSDLMCDGEDVGNRRVEFWVMFGPTNNIKYKKVSLKNLPADWHEQYHNYTVVWEPGTLYFKVDNEFVGEITPSGKTLCEDFGFTQEECRPYKAESILAPFDKDFHIVMTLTAANKWYFPDSCINRGKSKAWINSARKALLRFWEDRENWHSTWTKERSSLKIDHIRLTAL